MGVCATTRQVRDIWALWVALCRRPHAFVVFDKADLKALRTGMT